VQKRETGRVTTQSCLILFLFLSDYPFCTADTGDISEWNVKEHVYDNALGLFAKLPPKEKYAQGYHNWGMVGTGWQELSGKPGADWQDSLKVAPDRKCTANANGGVFAMLNDCLGRLAQAAGTVTYVHDTIWAKWRCCRQSYSRSEKCRECG
jgi:hypothetical protein